MYHDSILRVSLTEHERMKLAEAFQPVQYCAGGSDAYINALRHIVPSAIPQKLLNLFSQQKSAKGLLSAIIIDNIPLDSGISGSPDFMQTGREYKSGYLSENIITALSTLLGEPYSIFFEGRELVNNLTPQKNTVHDYTGLGSELELDFHTENAALQYVSEDDCSPLGIFFLGLRIDESIEPPTTYVADAREALKLMNDLDIEILYGNHFHLNLPYRWRNAFPHHADTPLLCPLLRGPINLPRVSAAFYPDMVIPQSPRAQVAFENFHKAIKDVAMAIHITPGKLVYVDNRFTLHSRSKFTPTYDVNNHPYRWLQRVFVTSSLWPFRHFENIGDRVFVPKPLQNGVRHVSEAHARVA